MYTIPVIRKPRITGLPGFDSDNNLPEVEITNKPKQSSNALLWVGLGVLVLLALK